MDQQQINGGMSGMKKFSDNFASYLKNEVVATHKSEHIRGHIYDMAGGSLLHARLSINALFAIKSTLPADRVFHIFNSDVMVLCPSVEAAVYPDVSVVTETIRTSEHKSNALLNPTLVVEVLSDSTEGRDRGEKFAAYRSLASFSEYVLISQRQPQVDILQKDPDGTWVFESVTQLESAFALRTTGGKIEMRQIYEGWEELQGR
ncbi:MAG: Uma2 family endonuclease [Bacteroidota bacterium]